MKSAVQSVSDSIREYVCAKYLKAAIRRGDSTFTVNVGAIHKELGLMNRVPQVCSALESKKLLENNHLQIVSRTGPPSGRSTTVTFTYEILANSSKTEAPKTLLATLGRFRGIAKEVFEQLGGGEAFIKNERRSFTNKS